MLLITNITEPPPEVMGALASYQAEVDAELTFTTRSTKAKTLFSEKNKKGNRVFDVLKTYLILMSPGIERCVYCEDSKCDEMEHIYPKDLYPERCFVWSNYVYACGICNGPKNNMFAVFRHDNGQYLEVNPPKNRTFATQPPAGDSVLINPRGTDDPFDFCQLDLETFKFCIIAAEGTREYQRADYTFNKVLRLNEQREYLRKQRETAYNNYKSRLYHYTDLKTKGVSQDRLNKMIENLKRESHPTVWKEMQRQHEMGVVKQKDEDLDKLFIESPEALTW